MYVDNKNMAKSHDDYRAEMKARIAALLPGHGDAAAAARRAGVPRTSLYTWIGTTKKAVPDAIDAYFLANALDTTVEELVTGEDKNLPPQRFRALLRDLMSLSEQDVAEIEAIVAVKLSRYQESSKHA